MSFWQNVDQTCAVLGKSDGAAGELTVNFSSSFESSRNFEPTAESNRRSPPGSDFPRATSTSGRATSPRGRSLAASSATPTISETSTSSLPLNRFYSSPTRRQNKLARLLVVIKVINMWRRYNNAMLEINATLASFDIKCRHLYQCDISCIRHYGVRHSCI